jgi:hypothetical protein
MALGLAMLISYIPFFMWVFAEIREQAEEERTHYKELHRR